MARMGEALAQRQLAIVKDRESGMSTRELAEKYNIDRLQVYRALKNWGPDGKYYKEYMQWVDRNKNIVKDRDSGKSVEECVTKYKLSYAQICKLYHDWKFKAYDLDKQKEESTTTTDEQVLVETLNRINKVINDEPFTKEEADEFNEKSDAMKIVWPAPKISVDADAITSAADDQYFLGMKRIHSRDGFLTYINHDQDAILGTADIKPAPDGDGVLAKLHIYADAKNAIPEKTKRSIVSLYENECPTETILETFKIDIDTYKEILKDHYQTVLDAAMKIETPAKTYDPDAITKKLRRVSLTFFDICKLAGVKIRDSYTIEDIETGETYTVLDSNIIDN